MLTIAQIKAAVPGPRAIKLADGRGLHLHVAPSGHRSWRYRFRIKGREQLLTLGSWPDISIADARRGRDRAVDQLARGIDPRKHKGSVCQIAQIPNFGDAARAWHAHMAPSWSTLHADEVLASLKRDVFPVLAGVALDAITRPDILQLLRRIEARGCLETARRLRQRVSAVFRYAMSEGWCEADPAGVIGAALKRSTARRAMPALATIADARALIDAVAATPAPIMHKLASTFLALTVVRMATLRGARWDEIEDLDGYAPLWRIPAARMKLGADRKTLAANDHLVPLSARAVSVLRDARARANRDPLIFPGRSPGQPIGEGAIGALIGAAGFGGRHVPHGWRATFSTILNETMPAERSVIDAALGHALKGADGRSARVESAYNRALHLDRRRAVFEAWAEVLMGSASDGPDIAT
jgi:integrase